MEKAIFRLPIAEIISEEEKRRLFELKAASILDKGDKTYLDPFLELTGGNVSWALDLVRAGIVINTGEIIKG